MSKTITLGVDLQVNSKSFKELQKGLNDVIVDLQSLSTKNSLDKTLSKSTEEAKKLQQVLNGAWDSKLNQLDMSKFNMGLKSAGVSAQNVKNILSGYPDVYERFSRTIIEGNTQLKQTNKLLDKMAVTMANTVRFGISSSIFNNLTNSIQKAYDYTLKLDKSLNDIRIVSDASAESMEKFSKYANDSAKKLGASTLDYTKGALIYFQQGLSEDEVIKRTDTTIKMSNALGASTEQVSSYMTAIWNNFGKGAENLEYYGDVITALGASTASSAEEIAGGLEKFAAVGETIGLSYEYATSALATIVATTRQSEDTVGNALKTIFARIQGLKLGETLEDGTTLNKYSEALEKVGVSIKTESGELKDMDTILNELGKTWGTLTDAQKTALAQTVAGVRQYNQLMALMNNWGSFQENLNTAYNSTGTLAHQQDIYLDSLEAHLQRLSTEWEKTYDIIFDADTIKGFADIATVALSGLNSLLTGLGGGMGTILNLGLQLSNLFSRQIGDEIFRQMSNSAQSTEESLKNIAIMTAGNENTKAYQEEYAILEKIKEIKNVISEDDYQALTNDMKMVGEYQEKLDEIELQRQQMKEDLLSDDFKDPLVSSLSDDSTAEEWHNVLLDVNDRIHDIQKSTEEETDELIKLKRIRDKIIENEKRASNISHADEYQTQQDILKGNVDLIHKQKLEQMEVQQFVRGTTAAASLLGVALGTVSTLTNENLSGWEKAKAVMASLANAAMLVVRNWDSLKSLTSSLKDFVAGLAQGFGKTMGQIVANKGLEKSNNDVAASELKVAGATGIRSKAAEKAIATEGAETTKNLAKVGAETTKSAATMAKASESMVGSLEGVGTAATATGAATAEGAAGASSAVGGMGAAIGAALPYILAATAAIAALVAVIYLCVKAYNKDADAAKAAAESQKAAAEAYNEAKQEAAELRDTISSYNDAVTKTKELTQGTEEYTKALKEANDKARELIEKYKLFDKYSYDANGLIQIDQDTLAEMQASANNREVRALRNSYTANINSTNANLRSKSTNLSRSTRSLFYSEKEETQSSNVPGQSDTKKTVRTERGLTGAEMLKVAKALNELEDASILTDAQFVKLVKDVVGIDDTYKLHESAILENREALLNLADSANEAAKSNNYYAKQLVSSHVEESFSKEMDKLSKDSKGNIRQGLREQIKENITQDLIDQVPEYAEAIKNIDVSGVKSNSDLNKWIKNYTDENGEQYFSTVDNDKYLARRYAHWKKGWDYDQMTYKGDSNGWNSGNITNAETGESLGPNGISDDIMRRDLARLVEEKHYYDKYKGEAEKLGKERIDALDNFIDQADVFSKQYGGDFTTELLRGINNKETGMDFSSLNGAIDPTEYAHLMSLDSDALLKELNISAEDLTKIGSSQEEFYKMFQEGWSQYDWSPRKAIENSLANSDINLEELGLDAEEFTDYAETLMEVATDSDMLSDSLQDNSDSAILVAKSVMRMNKGIEELAENSEDWIDIMKKSDKSSEEYSKALHGMKRSLADVLDTEEGLISDDFIQNHFEEIQKAAEGDADAIDKLHKELARQIVIDAATNFGVVGEDLDALLAKFDGLEIPDIEVGAHLNREELDADYSDFLATMGEIISAAGMTADEANALFSQMGFAATFATEEVPTAQEVPEMVTETIDEGTHTVTLDDGQKQTFVRTRTRTYQDGVYHATGKMTAIAMETDADGNKTTVPKITGLTKLGGGSMNNYSPKNKGGAKSPKSGGKGGKGGKGKGGGSSKEAKTIEKTEDKSDRYHKVDTQIEKTSNLLDKLEKAEEKALGGDWVQNLTLQFQQLNNQIANYNEKLRIAQGEQSELRSELAKAGVTFNADGTIANYNTAFDAQLAKLNALEDQYNHLSAAQQEKWDENKTIDKAKDDFSKFKENMDRYDELVSSFIPDLEKQIQEAIDQIVEKQIEKFNKGIDLRLDMAEAERDWNEFKTKVIDGIDEDDIIGQTQARIRDFTTYYDKNTTGSIQALTNHLNDIMNEMNKKVSNVYGKDDAKELEDLRKYYEELMKEMEGVFDLQKEIHENYLDMLDEAQDKFDEQVEAYEMVSDLIEHDMNLIELVYGEGAYTELGKFYEKQAENNKEQLEFQKQQVAFWREVMDSEEEGSKEWENAKEKWTSATSDLNDLIETSIENLQDKYLNAIEGIFDKLNDEVTKGKGLDLIDTEWQLINKEADQYLDTINQLFETQALENKYLDAIDQTDNVAAQRKLKDLMDEELTTLREKDKLTQYDIERANKRYEIALKQIALEEAQQNKSTMRLRRDSQGNYRYEYVADNDAIDQARDELEKLKNDLYNFDKAQYEESLGEMYDTWVEYQDALKEAAQINDPEERAAKEALIKEKYGDIINNMLAENAVIRQNLEQSAFEDLALLYDKNLEDYTNMTDAEKDTLMNDLVPAWGSGIQEMIDTMVGEGGFYPTCDEAFLELEHEQDNLSQGFEEIQDAGDVAFEAIANGTDTAIEKAKELIGVNEDVIDTYEEKVETMKNLTTQIDELANSFKKAGNEATNVIQKVHDLLKKTDEKNAAEYDKAAKAATTDKTVTNAINGNPTTTTTSAPTATTVSAPAAPTASSFKGISNISGHDALVDVVWGVWQGRYGNGTARRAALQSAYGVEGQKIIQGLVNNTQGYTKSKTKLGNRLSALGYDTGGYTGSWNNNGRLAFLHQKELVLNATDTENMLNAINVMRNLTNSVGIATLARLASLGASGSAGIGGNGLEQNVHISATFPNATSTREIEEALLNLTNRASQMIGRR